VRRQTATSGIIPAGSSRALRLDPLSLPVSFNAHDVRADGGTRQVELHRERVVLRRAVHGMRMAINVRVSDFLGVALHDIKESQMLVLRHRDPSLSVTLCVRGPRRDRRRLADVERIVLAAAVAGRDARARGPAPPPQRDPRKAAEIPDASPDRRTAQPREQLPRRA
jgi:hypothetical protein